MIRFTANLTQLYNEVGFLERFDLAARDGFQAVELKDPFSYGKDAVIDALRRNNLKTVLFNAPAGDWDGGERGIGCLPGREEECRAGVALSIEYALALDCRLVNLLGGIPPKGTDPALVRRTFVGNLRHAAAEFKKHGLKLVIEPVNTYDSPGVFLTRTAQAAEIIREVGAGNLGIEYDMYQAQLMEGDLSNTIRKYLPLIWHMQAGDAPSRAEPGTGEINFDHVFGVIDKAGYQGWIGCDYKPSGRTSECFGWMAKWAPEIARRAAANG